MRTNEAYTELKKWFKTLRDLHNASEMLTVDGEMVMKPGSANARGEVIETLAKLISQTTLDPKIPDLFADAEAGSAELSDADRRNLVLMRRHYTHNACLPEALSMEVAKAAFEGEQMHSEHRASGDWSVMGPVYTRNFKLAAEMGAYKKEALGVETVHDALIDSFSPGLSTAIIDPYFAELDEGLKRLIGRAKDRAAQSAAPLVQKGPFDVGAQETLNRKLLSCLGLDDQRAVFYFSEKAHPFMAGFRNDTRIVTRLSPEEFLSTIMGTLHEGGHALYEQNLPADWNDTKLGANMGMAVHESQSMVIEYQAAMSEEYISYIAREAREAFDRASDPAFTDDNMLTLMRRVEPSFIRIDADEVTYPSHIMLRYELERDIFAGNLAVKDLPDAFNAKMEDKLGITPPSNDKGVMQDVHWAGMLQGYFPAYTFGAGLAAQLFAKATSDHPEIKTELRDGRFDTLRVWLNKNIHEKGSSLEYPDLVREATGEDLNPAAYLKHLESRYC
ncbi:MAG: peptidase M32 [Pseudobdellovibrionaceae bacterium]